jgi:hypothetical protein
MNALLLLLWIPALDADAVRQHGQWNEYRFRYAAASALTTREDGAALDLEFKGTGIAVRLGAHNVPAYGPPNLGDLVATVDGGKPVILHPRVSPREVVLADGLKPGAHRLRIVHRVGKNGASACRVEGFRTWSDERGALEFQLNGEANAFLVDARAVLRRDGTVVRDSLVRNWLTGCCSMTGLKPGKYTLEIIAAGWQTAMAEDIVIRAGKTTEAPPLFLRRAAATVISSFRFPALNRQAIRKPGQSFRARFLGFKTTIEEVTLIRRVGPAVISRKLAFEEDKSAGYYYDREVVARLPPDMPAGLYDLSVSIAGGGRSGICRSPRSVHVVREWPRDPVLITFGHLDTSAQYQAEYLGRIAEMANLSGADFVLQSTAVNPAYISGALARLEIPHIVNFGNHQFYGHEEWYGDPVGRIDFGPDLAILNFGRLWFDKDSVAKADKLLAARQDSKMKIINAFESNAPIEFLDRHRVRLIHDGHGLGQKVDELGGTPTLRVGKVNSVSFRVVRFKDNRVVSATYNGHATKPIPFARDAEPPLKLAHSASNDGTQSRISTIVSNSLLDSWPNGRVTWVLPQGDYAVKGGRLESNVTSDDGRFSVVSARMDIPASGQTVVAVEPK